MSWRVIFLTLLIAAAASAWGGLRIGEWLVAYGPSIVAPENTPLKADVLLDADGRPYTQAPPQPLVDGRLAVPQKPEPTHWEIENESLAEAKTNPLIDISTASITMAQARQIAADPEPDSLVGIADVGALIDSFGQNNNNAQLQPIEMPDIQPSQQYQPANTQGTNTAWLGDLQRALAACNTESFFERPSCVWSARNQYCTPNSAWGKVPECPGR